MISLHAKYDPMIWAIIPTILVQDKYSVFDIRFTILAFNLIIRYHK